MTVSNEQFQALMNRSQRREQRARVAAFALAVIPALVGLAFLGFSLWRTSTVEQELVQTQDQLETSQVVLQETINRYQSVDALLNEAALAQAQAEQAREAALQERDAAAAQLEDTQQQLALASTRLEESQTSLAAVQGRLTEQEQFTQALQEQVRRASQLATARSLDEWHAWRDRSWESFGRLYANFPERLAVLERLLGTLDRQYTALPPFNLNGAAPETGFNSPSFAVHVLQTIGRVPEPAAPVLTAEALREHLLANGLQPRQERAPQPGDLLIYDEGLVMFYLPDPQGQRPFVMGMTAAGVKTVDPGFGQITDIIAVLP